MPVSPATIPEPNESKMLLINDTALPSLSTTVRYVVSLPTLMSPGGGESSALFGLMRATASSVVFERSWATGTFANDGSAM